MGAAADDLAEKKRRQEATQEQQRQNEQQFQSAADRDFEYQMRDVAAAKASDEAYDKAGQAAKDLKT